MARLLLLLCVGLMIATPVFNASISQIAKKQLVEIARRRLAELQEAAQEETRAGLLGQGPPNEEGPSNGEGPSNEQVVPPIGGVISILKELRRQEVGIAGTAYGIVNLIADLLVSKDKRQQFIEGVHARRDEILADHVRDIPFAIPSGDGLPAKRMEIEEDPAEQLGADETVNNAGLIGPLKQSVIGGLMIHATVQAIAEKLQILQDALAKMDEETIDEEEADEGDDDSESDEEDTGNDGPPSEEESEDDDFNGEEGTEEESGTENGQPGGSEAGQPGGTGAGVTESTGAGVTGSTGAGVTGGTGADGTADNGAGADGTADRSYAAGEEEEGVEEVEREAVRMLLKDLTRRRMIKNP